LAQVFDIKIHDTVKNAVFWDVTPCGTDVSEELRAFIIRVKGIGEVGAKLLRNVGSYKTHSA
jgi:hypothetical protein